MTPVLDTLAEPIVQAPMAGGPSTPELAVAVCRSGALGFLAAGYRAASDVTRDIEAVRRGTSRPFGVNLFVPGSGAADPELLAPYVDELRAEGGPLGEPRHDDDDWEAKLNAVTRGRVAVVSFTFGCPDAQMIDRLHAAGAEAWVTVTSVGEAATAQRAGADALVVQGTEAGGHRGGFSDGEEAGGTGLIALVRLVARAVSLPLVATGGIADGAAVAAALCAGARAAQIGTALMLACEARTVPAQRELLTQGIPTALTRAFTGRLARGMVNRFQAEHTATAPSAYPEIHHVTAPLRAAARRRGDADAFNLWAGQAHELARAQPAGEIIAQMGADARRAVADVSSRLRGTSG